MEAYNLGEISLPWTDGGSSRCGFFWALGDVIWMRMMMCSGFRTQNRVNSIRDDRERGEPFSRQPNKILYGGLCRC